MSSQKSHYQKNKSIHKSPKDRTSNTKVNSNSKQLNSIPKRSLTPQEEENVKRTTIGQHLLNITKSIFNKKTIIGLYLTGLLIFALSKRNMLHPPNFGHNKGQANSSQTLNPSHKKSQVNSSQTLNPSHKT